MENLSGEVLGKSLNTATKENDVSTLENICQELCNTSRGATIDAKDDEGKTPLFIAAEAVIKDALKILLKYADVNAKSMKGYTALHAAIGTDKIEDETMEQNQIEIVQELLNLPNIDVNAQDDNLATPLHHLTNNLNALKELLKHPKLNVNAKDINLNTALHLYVEEDDYQAAQEFLKLDELEVNSKNKFGSTPLHYGAIHDCSESVKVLLTHKSINVNAEGQDSRTPLHFSAIYNSKKAALDLLENDDIDVNAVDRFGKTAHHYAAIHADTELIRILLKKGADLTIKDNSGEIANIPKEVIEELLDDCINNTQLLTHQFDKANNVQFDFALFLHPSLERRNKDRCNYQVLQLEESQTKDSIPMHIETYIISLFISMREENLQLLNHPLMENFLQMKWQKISKFYDVWVFFKVCFFIIFTGYLLTTYWPDYNSLEQSTALNATKDDSSPESLGTIFLSSAVFKTLLGIWTFALLLVEFVELLSSPTEYFKQLLNYFQLCIIFGTIILLSSNEITITSQRKHLAAVLLPFIYLETAREIGYHPQRAHVIQMFFKVTQTFFSYLIWYVFLVISCGISFFIIFGSSGENFTDWKKVALKTFVMFIGEIDFADIPVESDDILNFASEFILIMFFLMMTVVILMNLLNGLAVSDTEKIREDTKIIGLSTILELLSFWESILLGEPDGNLKHNILIPVFGRKKLLVSVWKKYFSLISTYQTIRFSLVAEKTDGWCLGKEPRYRIIEEEKEGEENSLKDIYLSKELMDAALYVIKKKEMKEEEMEKAKIQSKAIEEVNNEVREMREEIKDLISKFDDLQNIIMKKEQKMLTETDDIKTK